MKLGRTYASVLLLLLAASSAIAGETGGIAWHRDVRSAWLAAQKNNHPLLVFVTSENCLYCTQMKTRTYADRSVIGAVNQSFEAVALDANVESPLLKELRVTAYPTTFIISTKAVILDRMEGFVEPVAMANRLSAQRPTVPVAKIAKDP